MRRARIALFSSFRAVYATMRVLPHWMRRSMPTLSFKLTTEYIALCDLLKLTGLAASGGQGKALVAAGHVQVDGRPEVRKAAKIRAGHVVQCFDTRIEVQGP
jgi:ribosome-associated protein